MIPTRTLTLARTHEDGVRRRTRLERREDGSWDLLEEARDSDTGEWRPVGHERVRGVWVDGELHGAFGAREKSGVGEVSRGP